MFDHFVLLRTNTQAAMKTLKVTVRNSEGYYVDVKDGKGVIYGDPEPVPPVPEGYAIVTGKNLAMRQGPSTSCKVITRAPTGTKVKITQPPSEWEYVTYNGKQGYMMKMYLKE